MNIIDTPITDIGVAIIKNHRREYLLIEYMWDTKRWQFPYFTLQNTEDIPAVISKKIEEFLKIPGADLITPNECGTYAVEKDAYYDTSGKLMHCRRNYFCLRFRYIGARKIESNENKEIISYAWVDENDVRGALSMITPSNRKRVFLEAFEKSKL